MSDLTDSIAAGLTSPRAEELKLKSALIDFLLLENPQFMIASETIFAGGRRRADIVQISNYLCAFEVKTNSDNLDKLKEQIPDYLRCFNEVTLVTTRKHISGARRTIPSSVGIIIFESGSLYHIRKARPRLRLDKGYLLSLLDKETIRRCLKEIGVSKNFLDLQEARTALSEGTPYQFVFRNVVDFLREKYHAPFTSFIANRGSTTHIEDLQLLRQSSVEIS